MSLLTVQIFIDFSCYRCCPWTGGVGHLVYVRENSGDCVAALCMNGDSSMYFAEAICVFDCC
jgi:hypothetical protein